MNKEDLIAMGLTEKQAKKVMDSLDGNFVTKTRFNEVNEENKTLKKSVSDRDKQLEDLKKSSGDNAALQQQISDLQKQNADQQKAHDEELAKLKLDNAIEIALSGAKAKNGKAVKAMLDMSKVKMGEDGKLSGFDEQIEALKKSDSYMFDVEQQTQQQFTGFQINVRVWFAAGYHIPAYHHMKIIKQPDAFHFAADDRLSCGGSQADLPAVFL